MPAFTPTPGPGVGSFSSVSAPSTTAFAASGGLSPESFNGIPVGLPIVDSAYDLLGGTYDLFNWVYDGYQKQFVGITPPAVGVWVPS